MTDHLLIESEDSVLIIIDVQESFTTKLNAAQSQSLLERVSWLMEVAKWLGLPIIVTVEDLKQAGGPSASVQQALTRDIRLFDKMVFSLAGQPDILEEVERTGRKTVVLAGLETDVCVAQSALDLMSRGYRVAIVTDATASPGEAHSAGLSRMKDAGATLLSTKGLFYEWMRTVERSRRFEKECAHLKTPSGIAL
jgi:nicotinamidase-related amidase